MFLKSHGFLCFAKNIVKKTSKNLSSKYSAASATQFEQIEQILKRCLRIILDDYKSDCETV